MDALAEVTHAEPKPFRGPNQRKYTLAQWDAAREDYIAGNGSVADVAARHGINEATFRNRVCVGFWSREREERRAIRRSNAKNAYILPPTPKPILASISQVQQLASERFFLQADVTDVLLKRVNDLLLGCRDPKAHTELLRSRSLLIEQLHMIHGAPPNKETKRSKKGSNHESFAFRRNSTAEQQPKSNHPTQAETVGAPAVLQPST